MSTALSTLTAVSGAILALTVIAVFVKKIAKFTRRLVHTVDDLIGMPAKDGEPEKPGISHRLSLIEKELKPNGGKSLKDQIDRLEVWSSTHSLVHNDIQLGLRTN